MPGERGEEEVREGERESYFRQRCLNATVNAPRIVQVDHDELRRKQQPERRTKINRVMTAYTAVREITKYTICSIRLCLSDVRFRFAKTIVFDDRVVLPCCQSYAEKHAWNV